MPHRLQDAQATLAKFSMLVLAGAKPPVAAFGYEDGPRKLVDEATCEVWELDVAGDTLAMALGTLGCAVGAERVVPGKTCRGVFQMGAAERPQPVGPLNPARLCECVAACQEEGDIVVEEAITTATRYWDLSSGAPKHTYLGLTGGAIGSGPTLAVGAAVACPGRRVINFQVSWAVAFWHSQLDAKQTDVLLSR